MTRAFSIYLDLVRFSAACLVYMYHSNQRALIQEPLPASNYGHSSVIVFFVLSGFVIAYVTGTKERTWREYASARLSRVYSVALPAVFLTVLLDFLGRSFFEELYSYPFDYFILRITSSLLLMNETWFVSITSFSNVPYWSICYEWWYYVAFGIWTFLPRRTAMVGLIVLAVVLGPKIVLLAPIWLLGVAMYQSKACGQLSAAKSWLLFVGSIVGIIAFHWWNVTANVNAITASLIGERWNTQLTFSKFFPSDYLLGLLVFANFVGMRNIADRFEPLLLRIEKPVRLAASYTFTFYLLHQPLFLFWAAIVRGNPSGYAFWLNVTACVAISVIAIGVVTENRRHLLKRHVTRLIDRIALSPRPVAH